MTRKPASKKRSVRKKLKVRDGKAVVMRITPALAQKLLDNILPDKRDPHRKLSTRHTDRLANDMTEGKWVPLATPITLDSKHRLLDGKHRLAAVIKSGVTIEFLVIIVTDPEAFYAAMDRGCVHTCFVPKKRRSR